MDVEIFRKGANPSKNDSDSFMVIVRCTERSAPKLRYQGQNISKHRLRFIYKICTTTCMPTHCLSSGKAICLRED